MKQVIVKRGRASVDEVPAPLAGPGEVLVKVVCSCISPGTELAGMKSIPSEPALISKVIREPRKIQAAIKLIRSHGLKNAIERIRTKIEAGTPVGYSASGIVLAVGAGIRDLGPGGRVACAGAGMANHAEFIAVPRNLVVPVSERTGFPEASTVALGSIALQAVRRADPKLGECVAVVGLGMIGQIVVQMLKVNGCRVIGADPDSSRVATAVSLGMDEGVHPPTRASEAALRFSDGRGVDAVIITASTESSEPVNEAMEMCRRRGTVVIVGAVGMNLRRDEFYRRELDLRISTSYGPGRYDESYELQGHDYPFGFVRWTENRNMEAYISLTEAGRLSLSPLLEKRFPVERCADAYAEFLSPTRPFTVILEYNALSRHTTATPVVVRGTNAARLGVAFVGCGEFARAVHIPNIKRMNDLFDIRATASRSGSAARDAALTSGATFATTDITDILKDRSVDLVVIATRHNTHAELAIRAAEAGKAVFVEKPMAVYAEEMGRLLGVLERTRVPFMVGFNRRFSPLVGKIKELVNKRRNPMVIVYRMNAGYLPLTHWVHTVEGGGRNIGEACHIYDLFSFLAGTEAESVSAAAIRPRTPQYARNDNFTATIGFADGSLCTLIYTALGNPGVPKETMDIYCDGTVISLEDYRVLTVHGMDGYDTAAPRQEKGHFEEMTAFARSIRADNGYPIPLGEMVQATEISFEVESLLS